MRTSSIMLLVKITVQNAELGNSNYVINQPIPCDRLAVPCVDVLHVSNS